MESIDVVLVVMLYGIKRKWRYQVKKKVIMISSSKRVCVVDAVQQFQHEMVSSDEENENSYSTPSPQVHVHIKENSHLMIASMISCLSKQSMVIVMLLKLARMRRLGNDAVN
jgi:hypothetical protein